MTNVSKVDLGFVEDIPDDEISFQCKVVPCKVGGRPSWLELINLPSDQLKCGECGEPCVFLCQIYAVDDKPECFHRTIFIFICKDDKCCQSNRNTNLIALRCQLPQLNKFLPSTIDSNATDDIHILKTPEDFGIFLCAVCGARGPHMCGRCKTTYYCCKSHQRIDWLKRHKKECGTVEKLDVPKNYFLFPKFEITMEAEEIDEASDSDDSDSDSGNEKNNIKKMKDLEEFLNKKGMSNNDEMTEADLDQYAMTENDVNFSQFKKIIRHYPDQAFRYERGGKPLWITTINTLPSNEIPVCELCQSPRQFEFQIMPQLLYSLKEETLDWGTIAVYTCTNNCNTNEHYVKEFVHKQDLIRDENE